MSKCIIVALPDGSKVSAQVDDDVDELPQEDIEALQAWIDSVKQRKANGREKQTIVPF